ncbi:MAG: succinylglutamate desuccinylase/aspartoacylase family protein [Anaerolineales bacterium]|nr:succinylglutamate desuccinylase/aspartoacylase family protein [Anaerolineales bacterium]MCB8953774.1 succinylglutamate desuccinylase/aspartoacylase family protein [Ardenticatenales bacterium]
MDDAGVLTEWAEGVFRRGAISRGWLLLGEDALGAPLRLPLLVARGVAAGPLLGVTALVHGDELNGLGVIHRFFATLDAARLRGTVVGVPVVNVPGFLDGRRVVAETFDLNRVMPGKEAGHTGEVYAFRLVRRLVRHFDCLIDLHTASRGRVNTHYVRADMRRATAAALARRQNARIILHSVNGDANLRQAAMDLGVEAITVEVGNPHVFQPEMIAAGVVGLRNALVYLGMVEGAIVPAFSPATECAESVWLYTARGGILEVMPALGAWVKVDEPVATLRDVFGQVTQTILAPRAGIVIGKSINPVSPIGARVIHLGVPQTKSPAEAGL